MSVSFNDSVVRRQQCRQWTPIITQQLRLRHLYQIIAYNLGTSDTTDGFHYTLHSTAMSAPFYTSEQVTNPHPKWKEINLGDLQILAGTGFVLRIWQLSEIKVTWGVHLSGLVYLGNRLSDVRADSFRDNTVIFHMRGGLFTSCKQLQTTLTQSLPCIDALNLLSTERDTKVFKLAAIKMPAGEIRNSYNLDKLKRLQSLQMSIRNKHLSVYMIREQINAKLNPVYRQDREEPETSGNVRYAPQLLTMTHLNKMMQDKPTKMQRCEIVRLQKDIEVSRLKNKILQAERDRKSGELRLLTEKFNNKCDDNEERNSQLMEDYHHLSKEIEKLREWKKEYINQRELLHQLIKKLQTRRRQLMSELLLLYPIHNIGDKYFINGVELPHSDLLLDCSDAGLSVALGYCTHLLIMCASFLQIPLRYALRHFGSRSIIEDHATPPYDRHRIVHIQEFPLFTHGKDRKLFLEGVVRLNKNIVQYMHALGFKSPELRRTLPNLLLMLQGKDVKVDSEASPTEETVKKVLERHSSQESMKPFANCCHHQPPDPILESLRHESQQRLQQQQQQSPKRRARGCKNAGPHPGLSQILAIPEAVLNKQMSGSTFLTYMKSDLSQLDQPNTSTNSDSECCTKVANCDIIKQASIEEGTEMIPTPSVPITEPNEQVDNKQPFEKRLSRSVGSFDEDRFRASLESTESEPLINVSSDSHNNSRSTDDLLSTAAEKMTSQQYEIQKWIDSGPNMLAQPEENLYPDEYLGRTVPDASNDGHLTLRTDALVQRKSFNLVKPKF